MEHVFIIAAGVFAGLFVFFNFGALVDIAAAAIKGASILAVGLVVIVGCFTHPEAGIFVLIIVAAIGFDRWNARRQRDTRLKLVQALEARVKAPKGGR